MTGKLKQTAAQFAFHCLLEVLAEKDWNMCFCDVENHHK